MEVAEATQYLHSEGIVHGDLHGVSILLSYLPISSSHPPQGNVLLDPEFHCQITDFGLTRHSEATVTRSTTTLTLHFAAPELFGVCANCGSVECNGCQGDYNVHRSKTMKTDVYAFGCLYYAVGFKCSLMHFGSLSIYRYSLTLFHSKERTTAKSRDLS
jgi:serine/threonine protein kinase